MKRPALIIFALMILLVFGMLGENLHFALVGYDTYPIILTSRIQGFGDLAGTFTEELMDGRYTEGHFYRPAVNLSFALDHALWGLAPQGYHLTDLLLLGACAGLLAAFVMQRGGRGAIAAAVAAGLLFAAHPVHLNILPVPARRADTLCLLFILSALMSAGIRGCARWWLPALFTLLAVGAKETGALAPLLVFVLYLSPARASEGKVSGGNLAAAASTAAGPLATALAFFAARHAVIGGLGGHEAFSVAGVWDHAFMILPEFVRMTFYPFPVLGDMVPGAAAGAAVLILTAAASVPMLRDPDRRGLVILAWVWIVAGWGIHGFSRTIAPDTPWYALHTVAPAALLHGLIVRAAWNAIREPRGAAIKAAAALIIVIVVFLFGVNVKNTALFTHYPEWHEASGLTERFLDNLERQLDAAQPGAVIRAPELPLRMECSEGSPIRLVTGLFDYTVQAWAELRFPDRHITVIPFMRELDEEPIPPQEPGEIRVAIISILAEGEVMPVEGN